MARNICIGLFASLAFAWAVACVHADEPAEGVLAEVLGKQITERDLRPPQSLLEYLATLPPEEVTDEKREHRQSAVSAAIMSALTERYIKKHSLEPTEADIQSFLNSPMGRAGEPMGAEWPDEVERKELKEQIPVLEERLRSPDLTDEDRREIKEELEYNRRFADLTDKRAAKEYAVFESEMQHEIALGWVQSWKFHRALFKQYGGRIIWQ